MKEIYHVKATKKKAFKEDSSYLSLSLSLNVYVYRVYTSSIYFTLSTWAEPLGNGKRQSFVNYGHCVAVSVEPTHSVSADIGRLHAQAEDKLRLPSSE